MCEIYKSRYSEVSDVIGIDIISSIIYSYDTRCKEKVWHQSKKNLCYHHYIDFETFRSIGECIHCRKIKIFRVNDIHPKCMGRRWWTCGYVRPIINNVPSRYIESIIIAFVKKPEKIVKKGVVPTWSTEVHKSITNNNINE